MTMPEAIVARARPERRDALRAPVAKGGDVLVVANHGRWIIECPDGDGGAQLASRADPRFMCVECLNASVDGKWRRVVWPKDADKIGAVLDARAFEVNRNWTGDETLADLKAEDREHAPKRRKSKKSRRDESSEGDV